MAISTNNFKINGLINPDNNILDNLNLIATCSSAWITFDAINGLWSVIVNEPSAPVASFNDRNIIGGITISGTGIAQLYNAVSVDFPHKDLASQTDYVDIKLNNSYWYPNEENNTMSLSFSMINDPIQAQYIGITELKQSRCDKIIQFITDYSMIGLKAGQVISITNDMYGFTDKYFRITKLEEDDAEDGTIQLKITAIEYDLDVYAQTGFVRETRTKKTGIIPKSLNTVVNQSDDNKTGNQVNNSTTGKNNLYQLDDVQISSPVSSGQILQYNGFYWANAIGNKYVFSDVVPAFDVSGDNTWHTYNTGLSFNLPIDGYYKVECKLMYGITDDNGNVYYPPLGYLKKAKLRVVVGGTLIDDSLFVDGDNWNTTNTDMYLVGYFNGNASQTVSFQLESRTNYGSLYTVPSGYPSYSIPDTVNPIIAAAIDVIYISPKNSKTQPISGIALTSSGNT